MFIYYIWYNSLAGNTASLTSQHRDSMVSRIWNFLFMKSYVPIMVVLVLFSESKSYHTSSVINNAYNPKEDTKKDWNTDSTAEY